MFRKVLLQAKTMKLLILNGPRAAGASQTYRGTYRRHPSFCDTVPSDAEINRLFLWFVEAGGELGVVSDLPRAMRYAELLNANASPEGLKGKYEVIEVTNLLPEKAPGQFLGIDLSSGYNSSLLWAGLTSSIENSADRAWDVVRPRWMEFKQLYSPKLNRYGLFEADEHAKSCLRQAMSIQNDFPNFFEGCDLNEFVPTGIYRIA
jgi:hypothetical protein